MNNTTDTKRERTECTPEASVNMNTPRGEHEPQGHKTLYPVTDHPNTVPPSEFMALGLYEHKYHIW